MELNSADPCRGNRAGDLMNQQAPVSWMGTKSGLLGGTLILDGERLPGCPDASSRTTGPTELLQAFVIIKAVDAFEVSDVVNHRMVEDRATRSTVG